MADSRKAFLTEGKRRRSFTFSEGETLERALLRLGHHPDALVVLVDGKPVAEGNLVQPGAEYRLIIVASGG